MTCLFSTLRQDLLFYVQDKTETFTDWDGFWDLTHGTQATTHWKWPSLVRWCYLHHKQHKQNGLVLHPRKNSGTVSLRFGYVLLCPLIFPMCYQYQTAGGLTQYLDSADIVFNPHCLRISFITWNTHNWIYIWGNTTHPLLLEWLNLCKILIEL